jgi:site-specific DNA-cytosine methylase
MPTPSTCTRIQQETELLAAGFPCVDISRAGNRAGLDGQVRRPGVSISIRRGAPRVNATEKSWLWQYTRSTHEAA